VAQAGYPRDLRGYGRNPPDPRWPGNARIAVQFVVNFEEGGENNVLHGDPASEAFLSDVLGAQPWPGQRHANIESMFEYGSRAGFWRLLRIFTERKLQATVFGVAMALKRNPEVVAAMKEAGWDIASHSLRWVEHKDMSETEERAEIAEAIRVHTEATGARTFLHQHLATSDGSRRPPLSVRLLCRRSALLDQRARVGAESGHSLYT
jgi:peptidoglycan/xylan/chitin deacetylase (PgdA/CDA1 family)